VIGAREFLIAYNVTLNTRDKALATDIAFELREKGRVARAATGSAFYSKGKILTYQENAYPCGNCAFVGRTFADTVAHCREAHRYDMEAILRLNDVDPAKPLIGQKVYRAGTFPHCKAIAGRGPVQAGADLDQPDALQGHAAPPCPGGGASARRGTGPRGDGERGRGTHPLPRLLDAGCYYLTAQGKSPFIPIPDVLQAARSRWGCPTSRRSTSRAR